MNLMDLVPVNLVPNLFYMAGVEYMKIVPTTDVNATRYGHRCIPADYLLLNQDEGIWRIRWRVDTDLWQVDDSQLVLEGVGLI